VVAHGGEGIGEGGLRLGGPGGDTRGQGVRVQALGHERDEAEEAQEAGRGAGDGAIGPLALRFEAEVGAHLLERHLNVPAADVPSHDLRGGHVLGGTEEGERADAALRAAHQDPAEGQGVQAGAVPEGRARGQLHLFVPAAVPGDGRRGPHGRGGGHAGGEAGLARPFLGLGAALARRLGQRRVIEGRVRAQARTAGHGPSLGPTGVPQAHGGVAAITDKDERSVWLPAPHQSDQHVGAVHGRVLPLPPLLARRGGERGDAEQRQGPRTAAPRDRDQRHQADPAQPLARHRRAPRRAHRVAEAPLPGDRAPPPTLQRVVDEQHQRRAPSQEGGAPQGQQGVTERARRPRRAVEHPLVGREMALVGQAHRAQGSRDRACARRQDRPVEQDERVPPRRSGEGVGKRGQKQYNGRRRGRHRSSYDLVSVNTFQCRAGTLTPSSFSQIGQSPLRLCWRFVHPCHE